MSYILMKIDNEDLNLAKYYAGLEMERAMGKSVFQTKPSNNHRDGFLGEIIFDRWLKEQNIEYKWVNDIEGHGDDGVDFIINNNIIDVKTAFCNSPVKDIGIGYMMFINEEQYLSHPDINYFFSLQIEPDLKHIGLIGGIPYDFVGHCNVRQYKNNVKPAYNVPLVCLTPPIGWLKNVCREVR